MTRTHLRGRPVLVTAARGKRHLKPPATGDFCGPHLRPPVWSMKSPRPRKRKKAMPIGNGRMGTLRLEPTPRHRLRMQITASTCTPMDSTYPHLKPLRRWRADYGPRNP